MAVAVAVDTPAETEGVGIVWPPGAVAEPASCWATTILLAWGISLATGRWLLPGLALDGAAGTVLQTHLAQELVFWACHFIFWGAFSRGRL